jgi:hypothetical protein
LFVPGNDEGKVRGEGLVLAAIKNDLEEGKGRAREEPKQNDETHARGR